MISWLQMCCLQIEQTFQTTFSKKFSIGHLLSGNVVTYYISLKNSGSCHRAFTIHPAFKKFFENFEILMIKKTSVKECILRKIGSQLNCIQSGANNWEPTYTIAIIYNREPTLKTTKVRESLSYSLNQKTASINVFASCDTCMFIIDCSIYLVQ